MKSFHIFNQGDKVLFRNHSDYILFNNRFAAIAAMTHCNILCLSIMSTHFHSIIQTNDNDKEKLLIFINRLKQSYSLAYKHAHQASISGLLEIDIIELESSNDVCVRLEYVMKNPVHHCVVSYPFAYKYSSIHAIYPELLSPDYSKRLEIMKQFSSLSSRKKSTLFGTYILPDNYLLDESGYAIPDSYIDVSTVRWYFRNKIREFMFKMNRSSLDSCGEIIEDSRLDIQCENYSDINVCDFIDKYAINAGVDSFHILCQEAKNTISQILLRKGISPEQIRRCLWL